MVSYSKEKTTLESLGVAEVGVHEELATARKGRRRRRRRRRRKASLLTILHQEGDAERSIVAGRARLVTQGRPGCGTNKQLRAGNGKKKRRRWRKKSLYWQLVEGRQ